MKMGVEIISTQLIKPSSPTPQHLKIFKLSLLDQLIPAAYAPIILFYPTDHDDATHLEEIVPNRVELLKNSLSDTLTSFYPLAGRVKDDLSIVCSDEGACFVEARVDCRLDEFLHQPDLLALPKFLPCDVNSMEPTAGTYVTNIQVNMFRCGGIAVGVCISHKILDGASLSTFLKAWTAAARGCKEAINPNIIMSTSLFPAADGLWLRDSSLVMWGSLFKQGKSVTRRIVFDGSSMVVLKARATVSGKCPTRVEAVSAFLWKCTMAASKEKKGFHSPSLLTHLVNLRRRMAHDMENSTGNLLWIASTKTKGENITDLSDLVGQVRKAISTVDGDLIKQLRDEDERKSMISEMIRDIGDEASKDGLEHFGFSSWCKLGFYEADFGWGKPVWVSSFGVENSVFMNLIILADTQAGDGIEAWVTLDEQDMAILEHDEELLQLAVFDPSPMNLMISNSSVQ